MLLGGTGVGKSSLLQKIITECDDYDQQLVNLERAKYTLNASDDSEVNVIFQDTRGYASNSAIMQIYRDKQAFIVICDISDEESLNSVPEWIH